MGVREQIKTGRSITLVQLIISLVVLLASAVGLYVKIVVSESQLNDRLTVVELYQTKQDSRAQTKTEARNQELKQMDERIDKNTQDIEILKVQKQDKK